MPLFAFSIQKIFSHIGKLIKFSSTFIHLFNFGFNMLNVDYLKKLTVTYLYDNVLYDKIICFMRKMSQSTIFPLILNYWSWCKMWFKVKNFVILLLVSILSFIFILKKLIYLLFSIHWYAILICCHFQVCGYILYLLPNYKDI